MLLLPHRRARRRAPGLLAAALSACILTPSAATATVKWFPETPPYRRPLADPLEARTGLIYAPDPDRLDATLGTPIPILAFGPPENPLVAVMEARALVRLGREEAFFPLQTFDGILGASLEKRLPSGAARLVVAHWSAHRADGDSTVVYRGTTFSREFWSLDLQLGRGSGIVYAGLGTSWHAVPVDRGLSVRLGAQRTWAGGSWRPFAAIHLAADAERRMRVAQTGLVGVETGGRRAFRLALRGFSGPRPHGQYRRDIERYIGADISFTP